MAQTVSPDPLCGLHVRAFLRRSRKFLAFIFPDPLSVEPDFLDGASTTLYSGSAFRNCFRLSRSNCPLMIQHLSFSPRGLSCPSSSVLAVASVLRVPVSAERLARGVFLFYGWGVITLLSLSFSGLFLLFVAPMRGLIDHLSSV